MSVAILIEFKEPTRKELYLPLATEGDYSSQWVPAARKLGLEWLPLFLAGTVVNVEDLPAVVQELGRLRAAFAGDPRKTATVERIDFVLERLRALNDAEIATLFIG